MNEDMQQKSGTSGITSEDVQYKQGRSSVLAKGGGGGGGLLKIVSNE